MWGQSIGASASAGRGRWSERGSSVRVVHATEVVKDDRILEWRMAPHDIWEVMYKSQYEECCKNCDVDRDKKTWNNLNQTE